MLKQKEIKKQQLLQEKLLYIKTIKEVKILTIYNVFIFILALELFKENGSHWREKEIRAQKKIRESLSWI